VTNSNVIVPSITIGIEDVKTLSSENNSKFSRNILLFPSRIEKKDLPVRR
jgi:hypothetical protein